MVANNDTLGASTTKMIRDADAATHDPAPAAARLSERPARLDRLSILLIAALILYAAFLGMNIGAVAGHSDSSGYLNNARLLKFGQTSVPPRALPELSAGELPAFTYAPLGFVPASGELRPTYPIGLPLLLAGAAFVTSWADAAPWTILCHALVGVLLMYLLGRDAQLPRGWAGLGALLLAASPLYVCYSLQLMSDVPATTWAMACVLCAARARGDARWALAAGAALGVAVLIRPTNLVLLAPVGVMLGLHRRRWLMLIAGGAPLAIVQLAYNAAAYGNPFTSGYGNVGGLFALQHAPTTLAHYATWLPILLTPIGVAALGLPLCARRSPRWSATVAAWFLAIASVYALYYHTHETWWYLRFLLPAFPAAIVAALFVLRALRTKLGAERVIGFGSVAAWTAGLSTAAAIFIFHAHWNRKLHTVQSGEHERVYPEAVAWLEKSVPANAAILAMQTSGALFYYSSLPVIRWDQLSAAEFERVLTRIHAADRPLFALLFPFEEEQIFRDKKLPGRWTKLGDYEQARLWRVEPEPVRP